MTIIIKIKENKARG